MMKHKGDLPMTYFSRISCSVLLLSLVTFHWLIPSAIAGDADSPPAKLQVAAAKNLVLDELLRASSKYFSGFPFMRAEEVYEKIVKGRDDSFFLVSVQTPDEYAKGHVPGAVNIPLQELADTKSLAQLPRNKKIVFTCEDGHRSMAAAMFLGQLGYETSVVSMGLSYWNGAGANIASPYPGSAGYPVSTVAVVSPARYELPIIANNSHNGQEAIIDRTRAVLSTRRNLFVQRSEVYDKAVKGGDKSYMLVSLQRPEDYAKGHVPGAINIPYSDIAKEDNLRKLPSDKKIVLICYVGHWAGSAALFLNQLGYEAYDMRFGTLGWNDSTEGLGEAKGYLVSLGRSLSLPVEQR
jgi:rhodanese-related sulfurtransferase